MATVIERSNIERVTTTSSCVKTIVYDDVNRKLLVTFPNGVTYAYNDVPRHVWLTFGLKAELDQSLGQFFNQHIRNNYQAERVSERVHLHDASVGAA